MWVFVFLFHISLNDCEGVEINWLWAEEQAVPVGVMIKCFTGNPHTEKNTKHIRLKVMYPFAFFVSPIYPRKLI